MNSGDKKYIVLLKLIIVTFIAWSIIIGSTAFSLTLKKSSSSDEIVTQDDLEDLFGDEERDDSEERQSLIDSKILLGDKSLEAGRLDSATTYFMELKDLLNERDLLLWAVYYNRMGRIKILENDTEVAIESLSKSEEYFNNYFSTEEGNIDNKSKLERADNLIELSIANRMHGNLDIALEYTNTALLIYKAYGDGEGRAKVFSSQGNIYYAMNELEKAEALYRKSLSIYEEELNYTSVGRLYNNIAVIHVIRGDYEVAIEFYNISIDYKKLNDDFRGIATTYRNIAVLYEANDDLNNAYKVMEKCVRVASEHEDPKLPSYMEYLKFIEMRLNDEF